MRSPVGVASVTSGLPSSAFCKNGGLAGEGKDRLYLSAQHRSMVVMTSEVVDI